MKAAHDALSTRISCQNQVSRGGKYQLWYHTFSLISCETTWSVMASCWATLHRLVLRELTRALVQLSQGIDSCFYSHLFIYDTHCKNSLHHSGQTFASAFLVPGEWVCVFLIGREELNCLAFQIIEILMWDLHPLTLHMKRGPFAWRKGCVCVTGLMTFTHLTCQAMRRRIRFEMCHRSLFFL